MANKIIKINSLNYFYNKKEVLFTDLNLQLQQGRIHGLLGKNGEGKTTLLKLMAGLTYPKKGEVEVINFNPQKRAVGFLQEVFFLPDELPRMNLSILDYQRSYSPFYPKFSPDQFNFYLKQFDLNSNQRMSKLSHGEKKKVIIAFGLACNTRIMLMDEPTNGLDIPSKTKFRQLVASNIDENRCLVISTHQVRDLESLIDNIIMLNKHKIVFNESIENITKKLLFKLSKENNEDPAVIYSEDSLHGYRQICENKEEKDSKPDIELLFNSILNKEEYYKNFSNTINNK